MRWLNRWASFDDEQDVSGVTLTSSGAIAVVRKVERPAIGARRRPPTPALDEARGDVSSREPRLVPEWVHDYAGARRLRPLAFGWGAMSVAYLVWRTTNINWAHPLFSLAFLAAELFVFLAGVKFLDTMLSRRAAVAPPATDGSTISSSRRSFPFSSGTRSRTSS